MKKIYLTLIIALSLITFVSAAIVIGNIYTQEQLDSQDVMSLDLNDSFSRDGSNNIIHNTSESGTEEIFYVNIISMDKVYILNSTYYSDNITLINETTNETYYYYINNYTINKTVWSGDYIVVEKQFEILVDIARWKNRSDEVGVTQAKAELKQWLKSKKGRIETREKRKIMEMQTKTDNLNDFDLEDMEI